MTLTKYFGNDQPLSFTKLVKMRAFGGRYDRKHPPILVLLLPETCHQELCHCIGEAVKVVTALGMRGFGKSRVPGQGLYNKEQRRWETERSMWHRHLPSWMAHPVLKETFSAKRCTLRDELTRAKTQCPCKRDWATPPLLARAVWLTMLLFPFISQYCTVPHATEIICGSGLWLPGQLWACGQPPQEQKRAAAPVCSSKYERRKWSKCHCALSQATKNRLIRVSDRACTVHLNTFKLTDCWLKGVFLSALDKT